MIIHSKTISRMGAVQILYKFFYNNNYLDKSKDIYTAIEEIIKLYKKPSLLFDGILHGKSLKMNVKYLTSLVTICYKNQQFINSEISLYLTKRDFNDLQPLILAILQIAFCELIFFDKTPHKVVINEFTDIASEMISRHEVGFINSLLDKFAQREEKNSLHISADQMINI